MSNSYKRPKNFEMCPPGYHVVKGHYRTCKSGTVTWVDAHIRKNRSKKTMYLIENLLHLYWNNKKKYKKLKAIKGFSGHHEVDPVIQFWLDYWKQQGVKFPAGLTPLHIKTMIAVESSFNPKAKAKTSTAVGLMQVLATARSALKGTKNTRKNEVRNFYISISKEQIEDPVANVAVGIRWLAHKFFLIRNHKDKSLKTVIGNYYSKGKSGKEYAKKVITLYNNSK